MTTVRVGLDTAIRTRQIASRPANQTTAESEAKASLMSVTVRVPTTLRTLTGGESEVAVAGDTVGDVLSALEVAHPGFRERILDENGKLRRFVNVFVSDDDIRFLDGLSTKVPDGETVAIIPAVAGG